MELTDENLDYKKEISNRWNHCNNCDRFNSTTKQCKECGCFMFIKIFIPQSECPLKKW